jgi:BASS family bile acid:Na+ symporter
MLLSAIVWTSVALPILLGLVYLALGFPEKFPELFPGCMLQAIASPIMAASAFASLIGLNASLVLFTLVISTALLPLSAPIFTLFFMDSTFTISPYILAAKLSLIIAGAALSGSLLRRFAGLSKVQKYNNEIDGFNVIILFVFAAIIMKDVGASIISQPGTVLILAILATAVFIILLISTVVVFLPSGIENALALGLMASHRNMGLMLAVTGGALPDLAWLFFALSQFPIYIGPHLLKPTIHRLLRITQ